MKESISGTPLPAPLSQAKPKKVNPYIDLYQSPGRTLFLLALFIFLSETLVMHLLQFFSFEFDSLLFEAVVDSSLLLVILAPSLYFIVFYPLVLQINQRQEAEESQRDVNEVLEEAAMKQEKQLWLQIGQMELNEKIRGEQDVAQLSKNVISYLAGYLNAQVGVLYLAEGEKALVLRGSYAYTSPDGGNGKIKFGEGLAGQAALAKKKIITTNIPANYIKINSGWGEAAPRNIMVVPFFYEGTVKGVIELASFKKVTKSQVELLDLVAEQIGIAFEVVQSSMRTKQLLEESQAQAEELQVQQEELQTANEELEERAQALTASEERLQQQQAELEATNEELEERIEVAVHS